jgi:hypothetical protein
MAYKTTKIKSGMTLPKLAEQYGTTPAAILQANKIPKLSAGMVVKIPPPPKPAGLFGTPTTNFTTSPSVYQPQGVFTQNPNFTTMPAPVAPLTQGSFVSGSGQVNLQGQVVGGRGNIVPTTQDRINAQQQTATTGAIQQRPLSETYDPNAADAQDWINYWNKLPAGTPPGPRIMTRDQIWNMKAQARRRRQQEQEQDDNNRQYQEQAALPVKYQPFINIGNATNQNTTWRV